MVMHIASINIARVGPLFINESGNTQSVMSGIRKQPVEGIVMVNRLGIAGDEQADLSVHGGIDKAVYAYPAEHYAFWISARERVLKQTLPLPPGSMGENLTTQGLLETALWIGDRLQLGSVLLEVTEPRAPCYKFGARMGFAQAVKQMLQAGCSGVYLKVIETGTLQAGMPMTLIPGEREVSIAQINDQRRRGRQRDLFL
jgi:MOSC domain-containing protein YiiM